MIHLANRVYLEYADRFRFNVDCVVIQNMEATTYEYNKELSEVASGGEPKTMYYWANSIEELLKAKFKTKSFMDFILNHEGKLVIFADVENFRKIFIKWFRATLPNMTSGDCYKLFNSYRSFHMSSAQRQEVPIDFEHARKQVLMDYWNISEQDFLDLYGKTLAFSYSGVNTSASLEYLLASYYNGQEEIIDELKQRLLNFYDDRLDTNIKASRRSLINRLGFMGRYFSGNFSFTELDDIDPEKIAAVDPKYDFLNDPDFDYLTLDEIDTKYDLQTLCSTLDKFEKQAKANESFLDDSIIEDAAGFLLTNDRKPTFTELIEQEVNVGKRTLFNEKVYWRKMNRYLLDFIIEKQQSPEKFAAFTLVKQ